KTAYEIFTTRRRPRRGADRRAHRSAAPLRLPCHAETALPPCRRLRRGPADRRVGTLHHGPAAAAPAAAEACEDRRVLRAGPFGAQRGDPGARRRLRARLRSPARAAQRAGTGTPPHRPTDAAPGRVSAAMGLSLCDGRVPPA